MTVVLILKSIGVFQAGVLCFLSRSDINSRSMLAAVLFSWEFPVTNSAELEWRAQGVILWSTWQVFHLEQCQLRACQGSVIKCHSYILVFRNTSSSWLVPECKVRRAGVALLLETAEWCLNASVELKLKIFFSGLLGTWNSRRVGFRNSAWAARFRRFQHLASGLARGRSWWCTRWTFARLALGFHQTQHVFPLTVVI